MLYPTRIRAEGARAEFLQRQRERGSAAMLLTADQALDARKALEVLRVFPGITLDQVAREYRERRDTALRSPTVAEAWEQCMEAKGQITEIYARDLLQLKKKVIDRLATKKVSELTLDLVKTTLREAYPADSTFNGAVRNFRPLLTLAREQRWLDEPLNLKTVKQRRKKPITVLPTAQRVQEVLDACCPLTYFDGQRTYRPDATDALPAVGCMIFAGVRPTEMRRLQWCDVRWDHSVLRLDESVTKTAQTRTIEIQEPLRKILEAVPLERRQGPIVPASWGLKWRAIRRTAGIAEHADILRHTFASMHLAHFNDFDLLQAEMGHNTKQTTLRHYRAMVLKAEAARFWAL